jgi:hypothetical protein
VLGQSDKFTRFFMDFDFLLAARFVKISPAKLCLAAVVPAAQYFSPRFYRGLYKSFCMEREK